MTAIATITDKLNEVFAPMDARVLESTKAWAKGRVLAIREFNASDEGKACITNPHKRYARLYEIAGGKTWYNAFNGNSTVGIEAFVAKNCAAIAKKRNATISAKLSKSGVNEVISEEFTSTSDGFNGRFAVQTDMGRKVVSVDTIMAGGYNIQCLHLRVLVNVK